MTKRMWSLRARPNRQAGDVALRLRHNNAASFAPWLRAEPSPLALAKFFNRAEYRPLWMSRVSLPLAQAVPVE